MVIKKILNNNVIITRNLNGEEIVVMGKAIAYGKKTGELVDESKITKVFECSLTATQVKMLEAFSDVSVEYLEIADMIVEKVKKELGTEVQASLFISLTDHINMSIQRFKDNIVVKNKMLLDVKHFYSKEFEIGKWSLDLIEAKCGIRLPEDEAAYIALHIVGQESGNDLEEVCETTSFIQKVLKIVSEEFNLTYDREKLSYYRFVTHLKFFGFRMINNKNQKRNEDKFNNDLLEILKEKYVKPYLCSLKIKQFIEKTYSYEVDEEDILYLTIHIAKVINDN